MPRLPGEEPGASLFLVCGVFWLDASRAGQRLRHSGALGGTLHHPPAEPQLGQEPAAGLASPRHPRQGERSLRLQPCLRGVEVWGSGVDFPSRIHPTERLEEVLVKDVASSPRERDTPWAGGCGQGVLLAQGGQSCQPGTRTSRGSSNHPPSLGPWVWGCGREPAAPPQWVPAHGCDECGTFSAHVSPWQPVTRSHPEPLGEWETHPWSRGVLNGLRSKGHPCSRSPPSTPSSQLEGPWSLQGTPRKGHGVW